MLIKQLDILNVRKIRQATIQFHGPGLQIIQGINASGKSTISQAIQLILEGPKAFTPGMITLGESQAEISAVTDDGLKIRMQISDKVKQTISRFDETAGRYVALSGGVREFLNSIRSGLEFPWAMRDLTDAKIIELLKDRCGITQAINEIDAALKDKEQLRTETGRDVKRFGDLVKVEEAKHPDPIDDIKAEKVKAAEYLKAYNTVQGTAKAAVQRALSSAFTWDGLEAVGVLLTDEIARGKKQLSDYKAYTDEDIDALDEKLAEWFKLEEKAKKYDEYLVKKKELDKLNADYEALTKEIEKLRETRKQTLAGMNLGVKGLEIREDNFLYHNGALRGLTDTNRVSNWSTAESVQVFFSIAARFAGDIKVIVVDNAESLDSKTTEAISKWAETVKFLVLMLKVMEVPETLEENVIYISEGQIIQNDSQSDAL